MNAPDPTAADEGTEPVVGATFASDAAATEPEAALRVLRRGLAASPTLRRGLVATAAMGLAVAVSKLAVPVLIQLAIDRDPEPDGSVDLDFVATTAAVAAAVILAAAVVSWIAQRRLVLRAEQAIAELRTDAFAKVHELSVADHNDTRRGVLVARVTSDVEALARFAQWGLYAWTINPVMIIGTFAVMAFYSWPLALVVFAAYAPVAPWFRWLQRRQLAAYDEFRTRVSEMLSRFSEAVTGAAVVRSYGLERRTRSGLHQSITQRLEARMRANRYMAWVFVTGDVLGAIALTGVLVVGVTFRESLGLESGELIALLFLVTLVQGPIGDLGETLDQTQTAVAGWRKILDLLDRELDVVEPTDGQMLPDGPLAIEAEGVGFAYRRGPAVLTDVSVAIPAGTTVAIVGETGSGKTTFAKLLCRLADPVAGEIRIGGVPLHQVAPRARLQGVRMVPQDGFLFDTSIRENVRFGSPGATDAAVDDAFSRLDLDWWLAKLDGGLDYSVGERGSNLSIGERQLVALARAALADPGLLILDEATSAVDPETDQALNAALRVLARGRTMVSIAHRLATAEAADLILVFDRGRLVERGAHHQLVADGKVYARLHEAWVGNTQRSE
ncbi:MAG: ABC transporter ATP-binding protein [Actinomycetota bacterium]